MGSRVLIHFVPGTGCVPRAAEVSRLARSNSGNDDGAAAVADGVGRWRASAKGTALPPGIDPPPLP